MGRRSEVPVSDRREAVLSFLRREEPAAVIARRFGVSEATLYRWRMTSWRPAKRPWRAAPGMEVARATGSWPN
jgi:transposase-like protein